jgi:hypothetical protein
LAAELKSCRMLSISRCGPPGPVCDCHPQKVLAA